ncbi:MAG: hypothetical protein H3C35_08555 [Bacteroidetes bacterium]|nr:hypothetical protein [Bacteroidota bacterium]
MSNTIQLTIQLNAGNAAQIVQELTSKVTNLDGSVKSISGSILTFDDVATKVGFRLQGITSIVNAIRGTFGEWISESNAGEAALAKLTRALQNQGIYSDGLLKDIQDYAAARQVATGIDDDATVAIAGQLTAMGLQGQALKDAIAATQDLSTLMDGDMNGAVRVVADAFSGNVGMLSRYVKGLDQADIKQRGVVSIIEQLNKAIGGQAEAFGNTGAGAAKKFDAAISDLKQSFGDLLKEVLIPFIGFATPILQFLNMTPAAIKIVVAGIVSLAVAYAFLNTQFGGFPYALGLIITGLAALYQALKNGNVILATVLTAITILVGGIIAFNLNTNLATVGLLSKFIPALAFVVVAGEGFMLQIGKMTLALTYFQAAALGIVGAIAILGATIYAYFSKQDQDAVASLNRFRSSAHKITQEVGNDIDKMPTLAKKLELADWIIRDSKAKAEKLFQELEALRSKGASQNDINKKEAEMNSELSVMKAAEDKKTSLRKNEAEINTAIELELRKRRAERMDDDVKKQKELADIGLEEAKKAIDKRAQDEHLSVKYKNALFQEAEKKHQDEINTIDLNAKFEREKFDTELQIKDTQHAKDSLSAKLDNEEKQKLATATTEEEKQSIQNEFSKKRIQLESATTIAVLGLNKKILEAEIAATKDPEKLRQLRAELVQLNKEIDATKITSSIKESNVDLDQASKDAERQRVIDAENKSLQDEIAIEQRKRAEKQKSQSFVAQLADTYIDTLLALNKAEKKLASDIKKYESEKDATKREALKKQIDLDKQEIESLDAKKEAQKRSAITAIESGMQSYDANKNIGVQMNQLINQQIRAFIAKSVMEYVATMVGVFGPLAPILAPAAGLALQAILERMIPKFAMGGLVGGKRHSQGGTLIEAEEGEFVVNRFATKKYYRQLLDMNDGFVDGVIDNRFPIYEKGGLVGNIHFLEALNAGVAVPAQQVVVQTSGDTTRLEKVMSGMIKQIKKIKFETNIYSDVDMNKYDKIDKKLKRTRAAFSL